MSVRVGNRHLQVGDSEVWVIVLPGEQLDQYRVLLPGGDDAFAITAHSDAEFVDKVVLELSGRNPPAP
jgi:hypothetical protein